MSITTYPNNLPPILVIFFDRSDTVRQVINALRLVKPPRLYLAADAPRADYPREVADCLEAKTVLQEIDWPCDLITFFPQTNLGVRLGVSSAITWFFEQVEYGVILEHDCVPDPSFFQFCQELLIKYRDDERVMQISGNCFYPAANQKYSYYFSHIPHIWGWATWRRVWQYYDLDMKTFPDFQQRRLVKNIFKDQLSQERWNYLFEQVYHKKSNTWDYQLAYAIMTHGGVNIIPTINLVSNVGFGEHSYNSQDESSPFANVPAQQMLFPLKHPPVIAADTQADLYIGRHNFSFGWFKFILRKIGLFNAAQKIYVKLKK